MQLSNKIIFACTLLRRYDLILEIDFGANESIIEILHSLRKYCLNYAEEKWVFFVVLFLNYGYVLFVLFFPYTFFESHSSLLRVYFFNTRWNKQQVDLSTKEVANPRFEHIYLLMFGLRYRVPSENYYHQINTIWIVQ